MSRTLTKKQKGFVNDYLATGVGVQAALNNYEIEAVDKDNVARAIASENLTKPSIIRAIAERLEDDLLLEKHLSLLNKTEALTGEIDVNAVAKGLDMAYKIKGTYAAEKSINVNVNVEELRDEIKQNLEDFRANKQGTTILPQPPEVI